MIHYYTLKLKNPGTLTEEQKGTLDSFSRNKAYKNFKSIYRGEITLDFQTDRRLVPQDVREELSGLEILSGLK